MATVLESKRERERHRGGGISQHCRTLKSKENVGNSRSDAFNLEMGEPGLPDVEGLDQEMEGVSPDIPASWPSALQGKRQAVPVV